MICPINGVFLRPADQPTSRVHNKVGTQETSSGGSTCKDPSLPTITPILENQRTYVKPMRGGSQPSLSGLWTRFMFELFIEQTIQTILDL